MIQLSDHFTCGRLLRYTLVSNFVGKTPFAAVNLIMPYLMVLGSIGFMFGTGGSALIAKTMGEGRAEKANEIFSLLVYTSAACGVVLAAAGITGLSPVASLMGAEGPLLRDCVVYGAVNLLALPFYILQFEFQCLFAAAEKPKLGLYVTVAAGLTNMVLDALFVGVLRWGLVGAAAATSLSQLVGGAAPLVYFGRRNTSRLRLVRCRFDGGALRQTCLNGASELMSNISISLVSMLFNVRLMTYAGENGIAAYGVLMYVSLVFQAVFLGYSVGAAPVVSYHWGAENYEEGRGLLRRSLGIIGVFSLLMFAAGQTLAEPLSLLFVGYDPELLAITLRAFGIFSFSFLFSGTAIFGSSYFTALNDGLTSALISFLRTLVFECLAVLLLPLVWELDGIWLSTPAADALAVGVTALFFIGKRKKYHY